MAVGCLVRIQKHRDGGDDDDEEVLMWKEIIYCRCCRRPRTWWESKVQRRWWQQGLQKSSARCWRDGVFFRDVRLEPLPGPCVPWVRPLLVCIVAVGPLESAGRCRFSPAEGPGRRVGWVVPNVLTVEIWASEWAGSLADWQKPKGCGDSSVGIVRWVPAGAVALAAVVVAAVVPAVAEVLAGRRPRHTPLPSCCWDRRRVVVVVGSRVVVVVVGSRPRRNCWRLRTRDCQGPTTTTTTTTQLDHSRCQCGTMLWDLRRPEWHTTCWTPCWSFGLIWLTFLERVA